MLEIKDGLQRLFYGSNICLCPCLISSIRLKLSSSIMQLSIVVFVSNGASRRMEIKNGQSKIAINQYYTRSMQAKSLTSCILKAGKVNPASGKLKLLPPSDHETLLAGNLVLLIGIIFKFTASRLFLYIQDETINFILIVAILAYFFLSLGFESPIVSLFSLKDWKDFQGFCVQQRQGNTFFHLSIRCSRQNDSFVSYALQLKDNVESHYAETTLIPSVTQDVDQRFKHQPTPTSPYVFVAFSTAFDCVNDASEVKLLEFCNKFVQTSSRDPRDTKQEFSCKLEIKDLEENASFCKEGASRKMDACLAVMALIFGLAYPWACWFSKKITWYDLSLCKRVTL